MEPFPMELYWRRLHYKPRMQLILWTIFEILAKKVSTIFGEVNHCDFGIVSEIRPLRRESRVRTTGTHGTNKQSEGVAVVAWSGAERRWCRATRPCPIAGLSGKVWL